MIRASSFVPLACPLSELQSFGAMFLLIDISALTPLTVMRTHIGALL
jgi:hypothetical protein